MSKNHFSPFLISVASLTLLSAPGFAADGKKGLGYTNTPMLPNTPWHVHDGDRPQPRIVTPGATFSQMAPAPSDAIVLFDGTDFSKWQGEKGDVQWKIE